MTSTQPTAVGQGQPTTTFDERLFDAKLATVEARIETRIVHVEAKAETSFEKLVGKLDMIADRLGNVSTDVGELRGAVERVESKTTNTRIIIVTTVIGAALTIVGLTYGIIGYGHQVADSIAAAYAAGQGAKK